MNAETMNSNSTAITKGCHHIGLTVSQLEDSAAFFTECLGWHEVRRDNNYPAIFVSYNTIMVTLWQSQHKNPVVFELERVD